MRRAALLPLVPLAVAALAACSPEHAGAAAVVGDHRIQLSSVLDASATFAGFSPSSGTKPSQAEFQRQALDRLISQQIDEEIAKTLHVTVTDPQVRAQISAAQSQLGGQKALLQAASTQAGIPAGQLYGYFRNQLLQSAITTKLLATRPPTEKDIQAYYTANPSEFSSYRIALIDVADSATANTVYARAKADPSTFAALAKQYNTDATLKSSGGDLGVKTKGSLPDQVETPVYAAKAGDVLAPIAYAGQGGTEYLVIHVLAISDQSLAQARASIEQTLSTVTGTYATALYTQELEASAKSLGVHVSSRFGTWDVKQGGILAPGSDAVTALSTTGKNDTLATPASSNLTTDTAPAQSTTTP